MKRAPQPAAPASSLHPRNRHRGRYDFAALVAASGTLEPHVITNPVGEPTIDFANPTAVLELNRALLRHHYGITAWQIPAGYLCPPIPGRADYIHHVADLLGGDASSPAQCRSDVRILDIGMGANCIYPIIGVAEYGWRFVGTDIDPVAIASARDVVAANRVLAGRVECRLQTSPLDIFRGVALPGETFTASICNPPFHRSAAAAATGTLRKVWNLTGRPAATPARNFGGQSNELWCAGGEVAFVLRMIAQSVESPELCGWFTTLVSSRDSLPPLQRALRSAQPAEVRTIELSHGQKRSRILAWRFAASGPRR